MHNLDKMDINRLVAFTLAEVLLTLGIIGVVAAMTIPTLIENNQKTQYVTGLKKAYTNFNQVLVQYSADNGCVGDLKCTGLFNGDSDAVVATLAPYFKTLKVCGPGLGEAGLGCFTGNVSNNFDGSGIRDNALHNQRSAFITTDGMIFLIDSNEDNCPVGGGASTGATGDLEQMCGLLTVDMNGYKGPNNVGRDIFGFYITNGRGPKLYPYGGQDDFLKWPWNGDPFLGMHCDALDVVGAYCTGRVMDEGWQMNY